MATEKKSNRKPQLAKSEVIAELPLACADETAAVEFLERKRWGDSPCCPHCGSIAVYKMTARDGSRNKRFMWRCKDCGKQYTVRANSVLSESLIPLRKWCHAMWLASTNKNGVSALELKRVLQVNYRTALFVLHRLRHAMADDHSTPPKMTGTVEADETFVGGKPRPTNRNDPYKGRARLNDTKQPVMAVVQRGGKVRTKIIPHVNAANLREVLLENVSLESRLMTDSNLAYTSVGKEFAGGHKVVSHTIGEYVRGDAHTNTAEGFFSRVKRGLNGTYHSVSKEHLHRYLAHFEWLYNSRGLNDGERTLDLIGRTEGKRLMLRDQQIKKSA